MLYTENIEKFVKIIEEYLFVINKIDYSNKNFGNFIIRFSKKNEIIFRIINDRGSFWCEIEIDDKWYFIEDVFKVIGIISLEINTTKCENLEHISTLINLNYDKIAILFQTDNLYSTELNFEKIANERMRTMFKNLK